MAFEATSKSSGNAEEQLTDTVIEIRKSNEFDEMVSTYTNHYAADNSINSLFDTLQDCRIIDQTDIAQMRDEVSELWGEQLINPELTKDQILEMVTRFPIWERVEDQNPKLISFIQYVLKDCYVDNAKDPGHDISHIFGMLYDYTKFKQMFGESNSEVFDKIDEISLLAQIALHDVLTVGISKTNLAQSFYAWFKDGPGSVDKIKDELIPAYLRDWIGIHNLNWHNISDERLETYFGLDRNSFEEIFLAIETHSPKRNHRVDGPIQNLTSMMLYLLDTFSLNHPDRENQLIGENSKKIKFLTKFFVNPLLNKFTSRIAAGIVNILYTNSEPILCEDLEFLREEYNKRLNLTLKIATSFFKGLGLDLRKVRMPYNRSQADEQASEVMSILMSKISE